jgi:hypothetical protein
MSVTMQDEHPASNSVTSPAGVIRPIFAGRNSEPEVNHMFPSEPSVMDRGWLSAVGSRCCLSAPIGAASATPPSATDSTAARRTGRRTRMGAPW